MTDDKTAAEPAPHTPQVSAPSSASPAADPAAKPKPAADSPEPSTAKTDADKAVSAKVDPKVDSKAETQAAAASKARPSTAVVPPAAPRQRSAWPWVLLLFLVVVAGVGAAAWYGSHYLWGEFAARDEKISALTQTVEALQAQAAQTQQRVADQTPQLQRNAASVARLGERMDAQDAAVGAMREELSGGRLRVQLAIVEQLLVLAADRLQVARDVPAALTALQAADDHLAAMKDPRVFAVRQAIADERAALRAVALPDETGIALTLASLSARAAQLPFVARLPDHFSAVPTAAAPVSETATRWQQLWLSIRTVLSSMFTIRRDAGPSPTLLSVEQEGLIVQVLTLKLEGARLSLLRGDSAGFREYCESAVAWLDDYFRGEDSGVQAARAELLRLQQVQLSPPLPEVGRSLELLRQHLESEPQ
ncbi:hypothetical protein E4T66_00115 [Sinimarinibacterium sp. CAU 1509]|uniref:uroporphyrinogen-III C-methyltransferase n=1 Tax=Sinimarinibacterium sp. CAU 1509 TaxID=2562283 RepID=UPI0010AD559D|nr:uroporphyrinogen-III C-methyltransferase [Sinimarinibacterium sp. CAU 1509]TJY64692.1 hypothetical protein E4T66_00115 [Sinimarinibacterium sp. CAU 1509]